MRYVIKRAALADLKDIARYTRKSWGRNQEHVYSKGIFDCFEKIASRETFNLDFSSIKEGCFKCKVSHHVVSFDGLQMGVLR